MAARKVPDDLRARIEQWFQDTIRFGAIAQDTQAYNQATVAKDKLYEVLADYAGTSVAAEEEPPKPPAESKPFPKV